MRSTVRHYLEHERWKSYHAAVSLHAHTHHSRELMADLPRYIARIPLVAVAFEREVGKYHEREGQPLDFSRGSWQPPVSPRAVFESEAQQIERRFELTPMVSVTDHDEFEPGSTCKISMRTTAHPSRVNGRCRMRAATSTSASTIFPCNLHANGSRVSTRSRRATVASRSTMSLRICMRCPRR